ncbi:hypothetical protein HPB50_017508 [Hyalomma asiaticum]|uniref:Uncharacterized protein n=1 Tax=Hyalomma asiaticum TaxID=266040 RepID=A0ACB7RML7_HYAAI|nr:hypothetical protein HPB50_017508 [Hyalomma asiaticum]
MPVSEDNYSDSVDLDVLEFFRKGKRNYQGDSESEDPADVVTNAITKPWNVLVYKDRISEQDAAILRRMLTSILPVWKLIIFDIALRAFKIAFDNLEECPSVKHFFFGIDCEGNNIGTDISGALRGVQYFGLDCRNVGSLFSHDIASYLRQENLWKELFLGSTCGGDEGAAVIIEALAQNKTLRTFTLDDMTLSSDTLVRLAKMLASNSTLQKVKLNDSCRVEKAKVSALLAEERYADVFKRIDIVWPEELLSELTMLIRRETCWPRLTVKVTSSVDDGLLGEFFQAVAEDKKLCSLSFEGDGNTFDALAHEIAFVVKRTKTLRELTNSMTVRHGEEHQLQCILDALKENRSVNRFAICIEMVTPEIATSLSGLLAANDALMDITICEHSDISASIVEIILQGLRSNYALTDLTFRNVRDDLEGVLEMKALLKRNFLLIEKAVNFVLCGGDDNDKEGLDALSKVHSSGLLIRELQEETGNARSERTGGKAAPSVFRPEPRTIRPDHIKLVCSGPSNGFSTSLRCANAKPSAEQGSGSGEVRVPATMASSSSQRGYDPEEMAWSTISHSGNPTSEPIRKENLFRLVERRSQRRKANMLAAAAKDAHGKRKGHVKPVWKTKPLPKFHPDDFVVVLKPRTTLALGATFQPGELGLSLRAYLGAQLAADLSFVLSREQNLIVGSTKNAYVADPLLGDFVIKSAKGDVSLHGHLKESGEEVCHDVVTIANHETAETLKDSIQWRQGTILYFRKFGTSNKARLTFAGKVKPRTVHYNSEIITVRAYFRTVPACSVCGTVGHRADTCPNPSQDRCGLCGQQAPFVEGVRAPHECHVKCALCGGDHATNSKDCAAKYRKDTKMAAQKGAKNNSAKKPATRQPTHVTGGEDSPRQNDANSAQAPPSGLAEKRGAAAPPPPHGGQRNQSRSQQ